MEECQIYFRPTCIVGNFLEKIIMFLTKATTSSTKIESKATPKKTVEMRALV